MFVCKAVISNPVQRDNLCGCCKILGVEPSVQNDTVTASFDNGHEKAEALIVLFEQYSFHEIRCKGGDVCG